MQFLIRLVDDSRESGLRKTFAESHWDYLDKFAGNIIARGATRTDDGKTFLSSVLFVDFEDRAALDAFVAAEPLNMAGVYEKVEVRRWNSALGRLQKDYSRRQDLTPYLILGAGKPGTHDRRNELLAAHREYFAPYDTDRFIVRGGVFDDSGKEWRGSALLICLEDRETVDRFVAEEPFSQAGLYEWQIVERYVFGGRPGQVT